MRVEGVSKYGYMNMIMVAAFNVGNIIVHQKNSFKRGEQMGMFRLGSTIVMIFEGSKDIKWNVK